MVEPIKMSSKQTEEKKRLADYSTVGMMFPASIAVGLTIGYFLDRWLHTSPYLLIIFTLYGIAAGFRNLLRLGKTKPRTPNDKKE
jgi:ATP synthase protein I